MNLRMAKKGNYSGGRGENGDLFIKINVRTHPYFQREGSNILTDKYISVT